MTRDPNEVVKVYAGPLAAAEAYKQALADAGIESKLVGDSLLATFGSALPGAIELYVHRSDFEQARAAIERYDEEKEGRGGEEQQHHPHPTSSPKPGAGD